MLAWLLCWLLGVNDPTLFARNIRQRLLLNDNSAAEDALLSTPARAQAAMTFKVGKVTGPGGRPIACGSFVNVKWEAAAMPRDTWCYDVTVFSADGLRPIRTVIPCFPQDEVGFASFYPWTETGLHPRVPYRLAIVPLDEGLQVIESAVSLSPPFNFPACPPPPRR